MTRRLLISWGLFDLTLSHGAGMEYSIALVTGATSGLGYASARLLAAKRYRKVIITGRSLAGAKEAAAQLAAETKNKS